MILHLSDLHFGTERPECLKAIQQFCQSHPLEAVVVSGDLTQRARFGQFFDCKKFLDQLNTPYMVIPGNHDIPLGTGFSIHSPATRFFLANWSRCLKQKTFT